MRIPRFYSHFQRWAPGSHFTHRQHFHSLPFTSQLLMPTHLPPLQKLQALFQHLLSPSSQLYTSKPQWTAAVVLLNTLSPQLPPLAVIEFIKCVFNSKHEVLSGAALHLQEVHKIIHQHFSNFNHWEFAEICSILCTSKAIKMEFQASFETELLNRLTSLDMKSLLSLSKTFVRIKKRTESHKPMNLVLSHRLYNEVYRRITDIPEHQSINPAIYVLCQLKELDMNEKLRMKQLLVDHLHEMNAEQLKGSVDSMISLQSSDPSLFERILRYTYSSLVDWSDTDLYALTKNSHKLQFMSAERDASYDSGFILFGKFWIHRFDDLALSLISKILLCWTKFIQDYAPTNVEILELTRRFCDLCANSIHSSVNCLEGSSRNLLDVTPLCSSLLHLSNLTPYISPVMLQLAYESTATTVMKWLDVCSSHEVIQVIEALMRFSANEKNDAEKLHMKCMEEFNKVNRVVSWVDVVALSRLLQHPLKIKDNWISGYRRSILKKIETMDNPPVEMFSKLTISLERPISDKYGIQPDAADLLLCCIRNISVFLNNVDIALSKLNADENENASDEYQKLYEQMLLQNSLSASKLLTVVSGCSALLNLYPIGSTKRGKVVSYITILARHCGESMEKLPAKTITPQLLNALPSQLSQLKNRLALKRKG